MIAHASAAWKHDPVVHSPLNHVACMVQLIYFAGYSPKFQQ
jgi:hypothetical protein